MCIGFRIKGVGVLIKSIICNRFSEEKNRLYTRLALWVYPITENRDHDGHTDRLYKHIYIYIVCECNSVKADNNYNI